MLASKGEIENLILKFNWSTSSLGPMDTWPVSLKTALNIILRSGHPMFIWWGPELIMFHNDAYVPILGNKHPEALGMRARIMWAEIWEQVGPMANEVLNYGKTVNAEDLPLYVGRKGFAEETYFTFSYSPIPDDTGAIGGLFCACNEVTLQIISQRRLDSIARILNLSNVFSDTYNVGKEFIKIIQKNNHDNPFGILYFLTDDQQKATLVDAAGVITDAPFLKQEMELSNEYTLYPWPIGEMLRSGKSVIIENLRTRHPEVIRFMHKGTDRACLLPIAKLGQEKISGFLILGISPHLEFDAEYQRYFEMVANQLSNALAHVKDFQEEKRRNLALEELDRSKTTFFNNVSHEFRTPLTLMLGPLEELIKNSRGSEREAIQLQLTYRNALRLLKLVNTLLDFSKVEAHRVQPSFLPVDITSITRDVAENFRDTIEAAGLQLFIDVPQTTNPVYIDREMWEKVLYNLLSNAFKFTLKGTILVAIQERDDTIAVVVKDTGIGMPTHEHKNIFKRFYRLPSEHGRSYEGTGIGLALVLELVRLHQGEIKVDSAVGIGSTFTITIRKGKAHLNERFIYNEKLDTLTEHDGKAYVEEAYRWIHDNKPDLQRTKIQTGLNHPKRLILIVEDNADMGIYIKSLLSELYTIQVVTNGKEAIDFINVKVPDLILSDVMMPVMDGVQLVTALKGNYATVNIPIILLSARVGEEERIEGYNVGADDYLIKPFSAKELIARVKAHIKMADVKRKAEAQFHAIFINAPALVAIVKGKDAVFELVNPMLQKLWSKRDLVNNAIRDVCPELEEQGWFERIDHVMATGETVRSTAQRTVSDWNNDGHERELYLDLVFSPHYGFDNSVDGVMFFGFDVTEQVKARAQAEENEAHFRRITDDAPVTIWRTNAEGFCYYLNKRWYEFTGQTEEEALGFGWLTLIHADDKEKAAQDFFEALEKQEGFTLVYRLKSKEGEYRWMMDLGMARFDGNGNYDGFIGSLIDIHNRKLAEEQVTIEQDKFKLMADFIPQIIFTANPDGQADYFNAQWHEYTGIENPIVNDWLSILHPDDIERTRNTWLESVRAVQPYEIEYRFRDYRKPDTYRWFLGRASPVKDKEGNVIKWFGSCTDIDDKKKAEQALLESENRFRNIADNAPVMIWMTSKNVHAYFFNKVWLSFTGKTLGSEIGTGWTKEIHKDDVRSSLKKFTSAYKARSQVSMEFRLRRHDGEYRWMLVNAIPFFSHDQSFAGFIGSCFDIHENKTWSDALEKKVEIRTSQLLTANDELKQQKEFVETILDSSIDLIAAYDKEMRIIAFNKKSEELMNVKREDVLGKKLADVFPGVEKLASYGDLLKAMQGELVHNPSYQSSITGTYFENYFIPLRDGNNNVYATLVIAHDVTDRIEAERKIKLANEELEKTNKELEQFAYVASHDLQEPLRKIQAFSGFLERYLDDRESAEKYLLKINNSASRMSTLIRDVLDFSRLSKDKAYTEAVDLNQVLEKVLVDFELLIEEKNAVVKSSKLPTILGNSFQLNQLFSNLMGNALKFCNDSPVIEITSKLIDNDVEKNSFQLDTHLNYWHLRFSDNGIGFEQQYARQIFTIFQRLNNNEQYRGTGIGLALCQKIVHNHNGTITAFGEPDKGATFNVFLPVAIRK